MERVHGVVYMYLQRQTRVEWMFRDKVITYPVYDLLLHELGADVQDGREPGRGVDQVDGFDFSSKAALKQFQTLFSVSKYWSIQVEGWENDVVQ